MAQKYLDDSLDVATPDDLPSRNLAQGDDDAWELADVPGNELDSLRTWTPDPNAAEEWGMAFGIRYARTEPLRCGDKERERDLHRWELDPASADDYLERVRNHWH